MLWCTETTADSWEGCGTVQTYTAGWSSYQDEGYAAVSNLLKLVHRNAGGGCLIENFIQAVNSWSK